MELQHGNDLRCGTFITDLNLAAFSSTTFFGCAHTSPDLELTEALKSLSVSA
jgi:hypothetical protein